LLAGSWVQLCGDIDTLLAEHKVPVGSTAPIETLEELVLAYMDAAGEDS
jgi:hypothetical protein